LAPGLPTTAPAAAARSGADSGALADTALHTPRQVLSHAPTPATVLVPKLREQPKTAAAPRTTGLADTTARPGSGAVARPASGARPTRPTSTRPSAPSLRVAEEEDEPKSRLWIYAAVLALGVTGWLALNRSGQPAPSPPPTVAADEAAVSAEPGAPAAARSGDDSLLADVQQLIAGSGALRDARIEVAVANGIVTLSGEAPTATARDLAVSLASTARGVRRVFNMIEVTAAATAVPPPVAAAPAAAEPPATTAPAPAAESRPPAPPPPRAEDDPVHQLFDKARRQIEAGDHDGAERTFEEVLRIDPGNAVAKDALERRRSRRPPPDRPPDR
jgi:hypothetical protein